MLWIIVRILTLLTTSTLGYCMEITELKVDSPMIAGESGWLKCDWNSKGDSLYSVNWYFGTKQFYRWSPNAETPILTFVVDAFVVDPFRSKRGHVFVRNVTLSANGVLRCEVSGERPFFNTDHRDINLRVVDLPDQRPILAGSRSLYELHETVFLTCTSPRSKPAASLAFYINDEKAEESWLVSQDPMVEEMTGLESAILGLKFPLHPRLVQDGKVTIKCTASIDDFYWDSNYMHIYLEGIVHQKASRMEERATDSASRLWHVSIEVQTMTLLLLQRLCRASLL